MQTRLIQIILQLVEMEVKFKVLKIISQLTTEGLSIVLLYVDSTKGWLSVGQAKASDISEQALYTTATGGTSYNMW